MKLQWKYYWTIREKQGNNEEIRNLIEKKG